MTYDKYDDQSDNTSDGKWTEPSRRSRCLIIALKAGNDCSTVLSGIQPSLVSTLVNLQ